MGRRRECGRIQKKKQWYKNCEGRRKFDESKKKKKEIGQRKVRFGYKIIRERIRWKRILVNERNLFEIKRFVGLRL